MLFLLARACVRPCLPPGPAVRAQVRDSLVNVGIDKTVQKDMWTVIAGLLHLGNCKFDDNPKGCAPCAPLSLPIAAAPTLLHLPSPLAPNTLRLSGCLPMKLTTVQWRPSGAVQLWGAVRLRGR